MFLNFSRLGFLKSEWIKVVRKERNNNNKKDEKNVLSSIAEYTVKSHLKWCMIL